MIIEKLVLLNLNILTNTPMSELTNYIKERIAKHNFIVDLRPEVGLVIEELQAVLSKIEELWMK